MNYIILESQTTLGVTAIVPPVSVSDRNEAESQFHAKAAAAAVSNVDVHTVMMLSEDGRLVRPSECYRHGQAVPDEGPDNA